MAESSNNLALLQSKLLAAQNCHPAAVQTLISESIDTLNLIARAPQAVAAQAPAAVTVTEAQIDAILDEPASMIFFVTDQRHRMHVFARRVLELATPALPAPADSSAGDQLQVEPSGPMSNDDVQDFVSLALREAWQLGQTYWQQADSARITQQRKSVATHDKFQALIDETRAVLSATTQVATTKDDANEA